MITSLMTCKVCWMQDQDGGKLSMRVNLYYKVSCTKMCVCYFMKGVFILLWLFHCLGCFIKILKLLRILNKVDWVVKDFKRGFSCQNSSWENTSCSEWFVGSALSSSSKELCGLCVSNRGIPYVFPGFQKKKTNLYIHYLDQGKVHYRL